MDRTMNTPEETTTSVLPMPPEFQDKDWAEKIQTARQIQQQVSAERDRNPVDVVEYRAIRAVR